MSKSAVLNPHNFQVIDQNSESWDGSPRVLKPGEGARMERTPVGRIVLAYKNQSPAANEGQLSLTSGGSAPKILSVEALRNAPDLLVDNFEGDNLNLTNVSTSAEIWIAAYGPGFNQAGDLPIGEPVTIKPYESVAGRSNPNFMRLSMQAPGQYSVAVVYIGSKPSVYAINSPDPTTVPKNYTKVTASNELSLIDNWLGKSLWVGNLSADTNKGVEVELINL